MTQSTPSQEKERFCEPGTDVTEVIWIAHQQNEADIFRMNFQMDEYY